MMSQGLQQLIKFLAQMAVNHYLAGSPQLKNMPSGNVRQQVAVEIFPPQQDQQSLTKQENCHDKELQK